MGLSFTFSCLQVTHKLESKVGRGFDQIDHCTCIFFFYFHARPVPLPRVHCTKDIVGCSLNPLPQIDAVLVQARELLVFQRRTFRRLPPPPPRIFHLLCSAVICPRLKYGGGSVGIYTHPLHRRI